MIINPENRNSLSTLARRLCVFFILGCLSFSAMGSNAKDGPATPPTFNVGYRVLDLEYKQDGREKVLAVAVSWIRDRSQNKFQKYLDNLLMASILGSTVAE